MRTLALPAVAALLILAASPTPASAQAEATLVVERLVAAYGLEGWKDESATLGPALRNSPFPTTTPLYRGVYANPYADATRRHAEQAYWGHNLTLDVSIGAADAATASYLLDARIATARGTIPAKLAKLNATSFRATFDLDGENGKPWPALEPGIHEITLEAYRAGREPASAGVKAGSLTLPFRFERVQLDKLGFDLPERIMPGYADIGAGNLTTFHSRLLPPTEPVKLTVNAGAPNATVHVLLASANRAHTLYEGPANAEGRVTVTFEPALALAGAESGLLLLEAHLVGDADTIGNAVVVLPVGTRQVPIHAVQHEPRGLNGNNVPQLATVLVQATDVNATPESASRQGTLFIAKGTGVIAETRFTPTSFAPIQIVREARFQASQIPPGTSTYNLLAIFTDQSNRFYSFATATRGGGVSVADATTDPRASATLPVIVRNFNTNYDEAKDPGHAGTFQITVTGLPGGEPYTTEVQVEEASEVRVDVPFAATTPGTYAATVTATLGDVTASRVASILVEEPVGVLGAAIAKLTPAPGAALLALAALAGAGLTRRRG